jgi:hypothetical protein
MVWSKGETVMMLSGNVGLFIMPRRSNGLKVHPAAAVYI